MGKMDRFLALYPNDNTFRNYRAGLMSFADWKYGPQRKGREATKEELTRYDRLLDEYLDSGPDHLQDFMEYSAYLSHQNTPPHTARVRFIIWKEFLAEQGIEIKTRDLKRIRTKLPKGSSRTVERDLDHEVLRILVQHMDIKGKALFLTLASSGMRIGEALALTFNDIDLDQNPAFIQIRGENTKTGDQRFTFIGKEAKEALMEWLKVREAYMVQAQNKNAGFLQHGFSGPRPLPDQDHRVFPFAMKTAQDIWRTAVKNAGLKERDPSTRRFNLHIHQLRKFFRSQLALAVPVDIVEVLMGHSGYLTDAYRRFTKAQIAEYYLKGEYLVSLSIPTQAISQVEERLEREKTIMFDRIVSLEKQMEEFQVIAKTIRG
jgi:integrase